jgi:type IV pilus assembly protein PilP
MKTENALAVTDDQVAALLNIQAPPPYNPKGKADPFEPFIREEGQQVAKAMKPKKRTPQTPLEQIDLGQLKLVAIVASASGNRALVEQSSGKGFILKSGTYVGLNSGKVVEITIDKVTIEEEYEDVYGKTITQKKEITLPKPPGEL